MMQFQTFPHIRSEQTSYHRGLAGKVQASQRLARLIGMASFICITFCLETSSEAQQVRKFLNDYFSGAVHYSPDDPWIRSNVYRRQTGHFGRFYNCDQEECKRYSPYVQWKSNYRPLFPNTRGFVDGTIVDLDRVRTRINDGSCRERNCDGQNTQAYRFRRSAEFLARESIEDYGFHEPEGLK